MLWGKMKADGKRWGNSPAHSSATELRRLLSVKHKWTMADKYLPFQALKSFNGIKVI